MDDSHDWMYKLIKRIPKFHGLAHEDPHKHIKEFSWVCSSMKPTGIPEETMKIKAFSLSLQGASRDWFLYQQQPFVSWPEMQKIFLNKYF
ncbi:hypothetical protein LR48_Vigan07g252800 [Vigna angularis]|uniref:Retrotransposon gag domain-containing protein n=1 Tax=Phaseolus angularis TaxID=3914 RepID=A0A0L9V246_PHAAN|nr:hypothetical protein LR48_Vigan07g252800 [Vigna angularis]